MAIIPAYPKQVVTRNDKGASPQVISNFNRETYSCQFFCSSLESPSFICLTIESGVNTSALSRVLDNCSFLTFDRSWLNQITISPVIKSDVLMCAEAIYFSFLFAESVAQRIFFGWFCLAIRFLKDDLLSKIIFWIYVFDMLFYVTHFLLNALLYVTRFIISVYLLITFYFLD